ncbi:MAG TPA: hypothetical protein VJJ98_02370 [Sedimentisphaerales bacterium]|nr:hypothetical protein [Sedimentisphaerales bacterium]
MAKKKTKKKLKRGPWLKSDIQTLKKEFPTKPCVEVAQKLGRPLYAVKRKAYRLGIYKTRQYLKSIGRG